MTSPMNPEPLMPIGQESVERFRSDGAVCLRGLVDAEWIELLRRGVARNLDSPTPLHTVQTLQGEPGFFLSDICMSQEIAEFREFILNGPAAAVAARLMASERVNFWADTLWVKETGTPKRTRWHQDQPFFWIDGTQVCVVWCPLDPVRRENGLELVKGSHRWGRWFAPELSRRGQDLYATPDGQRFERMPDIDARRDEYEVLSFDVEPGDVIVFHGFTVHGAAGNADRCMRRAISTIWMGDDTRYGERPSAGRPHFHGHDLERGASMDSTYFPRVWPREGRIQAEQFRRFSDPDLRITN